MTREEAWDAVHEALPARWRVGPPSFDPGRHAWSVTARGPHPGRGKMPDGTHLDELRRRARLEFVAGAQEQWPDMTAEDLERVIDRAPS